MTDIVTLEDFVALYNKGEEQYETYSAVHRLQNTNTHEEIAERLGITKGTVKRYLTGYLPRCLIGAERLCKLGLLPVRNEEPNFDTLNYGAAWVLFSGSIDEYFSVTFSGSNKQLDYIGEIFHDIGIGSFSINSRSALRLGKNGKLIGRLFVAMGIPYNSLKADYEMKLPWYLDEVSDRHIDDFVNVLFQTRMNKIKSGNKEIDYWTIYLPRNSSRDIAKRFSEQVIGLLSSRIPGLKGKARLKESISNRKGSKQTVWDYIIGLSKEDVKAVKNRFPNV